MTSLKNKEIETQMYNKFTLLSNLYKITTSTLDLSQLLNLIMHMTMNNLHADVGNIILRDSQDRLSSNVVFGLSPDIINQLKFKKFKLIDYILKANKPLIIRDYNKKFTGPGHV